MDAMYRGAEIAPGLTLADLRTEADCALATDIIAKDESAIRRQLDDADRAEKAGHAPDQAWRARARAALRNKQSLQTQVAIARTKLVDRTTSDQIVIAILRECEPEAFDRVLQVARKRFPARVGGSAS